MFHGNLKLECLKEQINATNWPSQIVNYSCDELVILLHAVNLRKICINCGHNLLLVKPLISKVLVCQTKGNNHFKTSKLSCKAAKYQKN